MAGLSDWLCTEDANTQILNHSLAMHLSFRVKEYYSVKLHLSKDFSCVKSFWQEWRAVSLLYCVWSGICCGCIMSGVCFWRVVFQRLAQKGTPASRWLQWVNSSALTLKLEESRIWQDFSFFFFFQNHVFFFLLSDLLYDCLQVYIALFLWVN